MIKKIINKWNSIPIAVKVSVAYAMCSILQKCLSIITLPLFTRLLTTEQYGQFTIYSSWSGILCIFVTLNLAYGSFSPAMVKYEDRRDRYIASIQGICLLLAGIFFLIYLPFRNLWNELFELPTAFIVIMVIEIFAQTSIQLWSGKKRFEFKYKSVVALTLLTSVLAPIVAFIFISFTAEKGYARIIGYAAINILFGVAIFALNLKKGKKLYDKEFWKYAFGFNIPLLAYYLSQVIFNQSDRIMISHITGASDAAMYGVAYSLAMILTFVLNAINNSYVPWLYGKIKEGKGSDNKKVTNGIALLMALMIVCVIWFAPEIIKVMAGGKYMSAVYVVAPVAMSLLLLFYSQLFINVEFYYEEKKMLVWASIGAAIVNIVLNALLIPIFGFVAAGYTTLVSYLIFAFSNNVAMKKVLMKRGMIDNLYDYKSLLLLLFGFMISGFVGVALYNFLLVRIILVGVIVICVVINKNRILALISTVKSR